MSNVGDMAAKVQDITLLEKHEVDFMHLKYMPGFGNHFSTEALDGALPVGQNSPQECAYGLYAEQLSGTAFTVPRVANQRVWLYRIRPSVCHGKWSKVDNRNFCTDFASAKVTPEQLRWGAPALPSAADKSIDFVEGLITYCGAGDAGTKAGLSISLFCANASMTHKAFYNSDGDMLIVPQEGTLNIRTEMGNMRVASGEICVIQRGIKFAVLLADNKPIRGYVCEVFTSHFRIPDLGPIGANGLANPRDFETPVADYEHTKGDYKVVSKFLNETWEAEMDHSPFNVVAWHGNYAPYKYDLKNFMAINTVTFDHADPSIFTVLTAPTCEAGVAACDFVIFPPRWNVAERTFRPPYYHRNCMSEYMGLIRGKYEAKEEGFVPGGGSLHSCMTPHGPDAPTFEVTSKMDLNPVKIPDSTLAFMFESSYLFKVTEFGMSKEAKIEENYIQCWQGLKDNFTPHQK